MDIAEGVMQRSSKLAKGKLNSTLNSTSRDQDRERTQGFEFMASVIWAEVGKAIIDELGSVVFAAGRPDDFQKVHSVLFAVCDLISDL